MTRPTGFVAVIMASEEDTSERASSLLQRESLALERAFAKAGLKGSRSKHQGWHCATASCDDWSCAWVTNEKLKGIGLAIGFDDLEALKKDAAATLLASAGSLSPNEVSFDDDRIGELNRVYAWVAD